MKKPCRLEREFLNDPGFVNGGGGCRRVLVLDEAGVGGRATGAGGGSRTFGWVRYFSLGRIYQEAAAPEAFASPRFR